MSDSSAEVPQNTDDTGNEQGQQAQHMIPKSRLDEVISQRKALEAEKAALAERIAEYEAAQMSAEEKRAAEVKALQEQAGQLPTLQQELEQSRAALAPFSGAYIDGFDEAKRDRVLAYAKAKGIDEADTTAIAREAMALEAAGLLPTTPQPPPPATHSGGAGVGKPNGTDTSLTGAKARFKAALGR